MIPSPLWRFFMRKATRSELNKLRELFWYLIRGQHCAHCKASFVEDDDWIVMPHGTGHGRPLGELKITIDHKVTYAGNASANLRLMHKTCHARHTMKQRQQDGLAAARRAAVEVRRRGAAQRSPPRSTHWSKRRGSSPRNR
jgi:hypothetical protein